MKGFAVHNAPTDHGGIIPATQMRDSQMGNAFVRAGDGHFCPKCKTWSTIIKSHDHIIIDGKPVAYAGDKLTCGATIQPQQSHVVGDSSSASYRSVTSSQSNRVQPINNSQNNQTTSSLIDGDGYENYYIEQYKTDVFVSHKAVLLGDEGVTPLDGAVSYFVNYNVKGRALFVSVSVDAAPLSHKGKVYPFGTVIISRTGEKHSETKLKKESGFWNIEKNKQPVGSCTITLPEPNIQIVEVRLELGYSAQISDSVGSIYPIPPLKVYTFKLNSAGRKIK